MHDNSRGTIAGPWIATALCVVSIIGVGGCDRPKTNQAANSSPSTTNSTPPKTEEGGKVVWLDPNTIQEGPIRHETLTAEQIARIDRLHETFSEVDPSTPEKWRDGFRRDLDIDREIEIWEQMAFRYQRFVDAHRPSLDAKKEVFKVVLLRSMASEDDTLAHLKLSILSRDEAIEIMRGR